MSALFCALVFVATWFAVPAGVLGNVNLGDAVILLGAWLLGGPWSIVAAAVGSCLADLANGYALYAPATLIIKALVASVAMLLSRWLSKTRLPRMLALIFSAFAAELCMIVGYLLFEAFFLSLGAGALVSVPFNALQGLLSILLAIPAYSLLSKTVFKAK